MVVMAILLVLASAVLSAMYTVLETAKQTRTKSQIAKLHELVTSQLEPYGVRAIRLEIPPNTTDSVATLATARVLAIRDLMRMELPDRITDLNSGATTIVIPRDLVYTQAPYSLPPSTTVTPAAPSRWRSHRRRAGYATGSTIKPASWTFAHQGAECLYLIVASIREGESNGLDFFKESEIGDVDGDGMRELLDAWGNPIEFLRWAPGYLSELQPNDPVVAPDPFDPLNMDTRATFRLVPLIFSSGPDGIYDIVTDDGTTPINYPTTTPTNDPYLTLGGGNQLGDSIDANGDGEINDVDNVNNHLLDE
jgi:hypothetical protein